MVQQFTQGGSERQCAVAAARLAARGWQVHAAAMRPGGMRAAELSARGIPLPVFPVRSFAGMDPWRSGWRLFRYLRDHRIDVVHSFDVPSNAFAVPWARLAGTGRVLASQRAHRELTPKALRPLEKLSDWLADAIVVNSRSVWNELEMRCGVAPSKLRLVYNGIDTESFRPDAGREARERPKLPFPPDSVVVGTVCALRPEKGLKHLLEAFGQIASAYPEARLLIVGDGPERARLEAAASSSGLGGLVHFAGAQTSPASWYRAMDIFVLPSLSEALSNSLMEAMASGCACLASRTGGNPELLADAEFLFSPGETASLKTALAKFFNNPDLRKEAGLRHRRRCVEEYSLARLETELEKCYTKSS